jgi:hypothetical protein
MPLPTKDQINWSNPSAACADFKKDPTGDQVKDCRNTMTYGNCISTVNEFIPVHNQELDQQANDEFNNKHNQWQNKNGDYQNWGNKRNELANEKIDGPNCGGCPAGWNQVGTRDGCGKGNHINECKRSDGQISNDLNGKGYMAAEPRRDQFNKAHVNNIDAKVTDCCINQVNVVNSKLDNTNITQSCAKDGVTTGSNNLNSSGTTSGTGSTKLVNSSVAGVTSSSQQQQNIIIAIVIISIILSSSVVLLLLVS